MENTALLVSINIYCTLEHLFYFMNYRIQSFD